MLQLEFTEKRKPTVLQTRRRDPLDIFRDALSRQINAVTAALKDETVTQTKLRYIGGQRTEIQVPVQPWWWEDDGEYYLNLKYSTQTIHI
ncbi:hypothetical protein, partial [Terasakiella sp.]|uniref:hypothetical protein n=1 Tax=Terasakiella sp. TaxID=2034861 RepID=UPI003AA91892